MNSILYIEKYTGINITQKPEHNLKWQFNRRIKIDMKAKFTARKQRIKYQLILTSKTSIYNMGNNIFKNPN